jgi:hypothetical protein
MKITAIELAESDEITIEFQGWWLSLDISTTELGVAVDACRGEHPRLAARTYADGFAAGLNRAAQWHEAEAENIRSYAEWRPDTKERAGAHDHCAKSIRSLPTPPEEPGT